MPLRSNLFSLTRRSGPPAPPEPSFHGSGAESTLSLLLQSSHTMGASVPSGVGRARRLQPCWDQNKFRNLSAVATIDRALALDGNDKTQKHKGMGNKETAGEGDKDSQE
eukprot:scaffold16723_cov143-Isochrysis_galbana.AAC.12